MKTVSAADFFYVLLILSALFVSVSANVSKHWQHASTTTSSPTPSESLCSSNPVQCCTKQFSSDSEKAHSLLQRYEIPVPTKAVNVGQTCKSLDDDQIKQGDCGDWVLCCEKVYKNVQIHGQNASIAVDCSDISV